MHPLPARTLNFIRNGAPQGSRNDELHAAAQQFFAAGLSIGECEAQLLPVASRIGLAQREALSVIRSAYKSTIVTDPLPSPHPAMPRAASYNGIAAHEASPESKSPGFVRALLAAFEPGETIAVVESGAEGQPSHAHCKTREQWIDYASRLPIGRLIEGPEGGGFIAINPLKSGSTRRTNENIAAFRHVLVEFEGLDKSEQRRRIEQSNLPVSVLLDSARRSIHAWVRVDAPDLATWQQRRDEIFSKLGCDPKNKDIARVSRCPDAMRLVDGQPTPQSLLATGIGAASWAEWTGSHLPQILPLKKFMDTPVPTPTEVVKGVLHKGCKMIFAGPSKARKSWALLDLCLSVASGAPWLGFDTIKAGGKALYINFELRPFAVQHRIQSIMAERRLPFTPESLDNLSLWNLRGCACDFTALMPRLLTHIQASRFDLIVIDPIYKGLGDRDENAAGDINSLMNEIESLCEGTGAAVAFAHHFAKGDATLKGAIDRMAGSGVFARDPDSIIVLTPPAKKKDDEDEEEESYEVRFVVDTILRAHAPLKQFVIRWERSHFIRTGSVSARELLKQQPKRRQPPSASYRPNSYAALHGPTLADMPATVRNSDDPEACPMLGWISAACQIDRPTAALVWDALRHRTDVLVYEEARGWMGVKWRETNPF